MTLKKKSDPEANNNERPFKFVVRHSSLKFKKKCFLLSTINKTLCFIKINEIRKKIPQRLCFRFETECSNCFSTKFYEKKNK